MLLRTLLMLGIGLCCTARILEPYPPLSEDPQVRADPTVLPASSRVAAKAAAASVYDGVVVMSSGAVAGSSTLDDDEVALYQTVAVAVNKSVINRWAHPTCAPDSFAYLQDDGSIEIPCSSTNGTRILRMAWSGQVLWDWSFDPSRAGGTGLPDEGHRPWSQTHDVEIMPNGNILVLAGETWNASELGALGRAPELLDQPTAQVPVVYEIAPQGAANATFVWRWRWADRFAQNRSRATAAAAATFVPDLSLVPERIDLNLVATLGNSFEHPNAIDYNPALRQVAVSSRTLNEIFVFEHTPTTAQASARVGGRYGRGGDFLYRWGNPQNYGRGGPEAQQTWYQHSVNWIEPGMPGAGHLILYNDGAYPGPDGHRNFTSGRSAAIEIAPPILPNGSYAAPAAGQPFGPERPAWEFSGNETFSFYSYIQGGAFRLPNGNTFLTTPGADGRVIEVSAAGEVVWVMNSTAVRCMKWPASYVPV